MGPARCIHRGGTTRVEAATRQAGDTVLLADRTAALVRHLEVELEERPGLDLKGKHEAVPVYAPKVRAADAGAPRG